ncbi:MAG: cysteine hydrolase [Nocardia sp.]|nr:cysteine hydrolase [Nocardia sp.]
MPRQTLREVNGFDNTPAKLADATLILVDYQNTYTSGVMELEGWRPALDVAAELLTAGRAAGATVIHIVHDGGTGSPYDLTAESGRIHSAVAPIAGEPVVTKTAPNAFLGTDLGERIDATGRTDVVVAGFMTHMCVTFTTEGAFLRGNRATVVADACATRSLPGPTAEVPAHTLHSSALATIADLYGVVVGSPAALR